MKGEVDRRRMVSFAGGIAVGCVLSFPAAYGLLRSDDSARQAARAVPANSAAEVTQLLNQSQRAIDERKFVEALGLLVRADRLAPKNAVVQNNLCVAKTQLRRYDDAVGACNAALALKPDFELARNNLRWALDQRAKAKAADDSER